MIVMISTNGACRGNPGAYGIGARIRAARETSVTPPFLFFLAKPILEAAASAGPPSSPRGNSSLQPIRVYIC